MGNGYKTDSFESGLGYRITHTKGNSAESSTISYLHQTPKFILYYFLNATGNIKIEGKNYAINDGDIVIVNTQEMFCCRIDSDTYHERIVIHLDDDILKGFPKDCSLLLSPFINRNNGEENTIDKNTVKNYGLNTIIKDILFFSQKYENEYEILTLCKIAELLHKLCEIKENKTDKTVIKSTENPVINNILEFVNDNFTTQINIDLIAKKFSFDKSYLSHLFKEYVGISIWNYVIFRRISYFNSLIREGMNIEDASIKAGFNNYSNFFRLYKKHTGITPIEFKKHKNP